MMMTSYRNPTPTMFLQMVELDLRGKKFLRVLKNILKHKPQDLESQESVQSQNTKEIPVLCMDMETSNLQDKAGHNNPTKMIDFFFLNYYSYEGQPPL